jgi:iron complex transport system substrate-binding protein
MKTIRMVSLLVATLLWASCRQGTVQKNVEGELDSAVTMQLDYAKGFTVNTLENGVRLVDVADPQQDEDKMPVSYHFALYADVTTHLVETRVDRSKYQVYLGLKYHI